MTKPETRLRQRISTFLRENGYFVQCIESETTPGLPDIYYRKDGHAGWLELKMLAHIPLRETTALFTSYNHPLSREQINWIDLELAHGGYANILVGHEKQLYLVPGVCTDVFNGLTYQDLQGFVVTKERLLELL